MFPQLAWLGGEASAINIAITILVGWIAFCFFIVAFMYTGAMIYRYIGNSRKKPQNHEIWSVINDEHQ